MKTTLLLWLGLLAGWWGLARAQELKLVLPVGSNSTNGTFSPDEQLLATTSFAGSVKVWNAWSGTLRQELEVAPPAGFRHPGSTVRVRVSLRLGRQQVAATPGHLAH